MVKKSLKKLLVGTCLAVMLTGTVAYGSDYTFTLEKGETGYTETVKKANTLGYAKVERTAPSNTETYVNFTIVNEAHLQKSESADVQGIGTVKLSYSGYNVQISDRVQLKGNNPAGKNNGSEISASGNWTP